jgi:hypothetical protein
MLLKDLMSETFQKSLSQSMRTPEKQNGGLVDFTHPDHGASVTSFSRSLRYE